MKFSSKNRIILYSSRNKRNNLFIFFKARSFFMPTITKPAATTNSAATGKQTTIKKTTRKRNSGTKSRTTKSKTSRKTTRVSKPRRERIFALDIGTRSVIGIIAEHDDNGNLRILATDRLEHKTRAMLDGRIHDVRQVAGIIEKVEGGVSKKAGPVHNAAVAAAGRALCTVTAEAE